MKKFIGYICIYYSFIVGYIYLSGNLSNYLAPNMHKNIIIAGIVLLIIGLVLLRKEHTHYEFKKSDILLLIPIIFLFLAQDGQLDASITKSKTSKMAPSTTTISKEKKEKEDNNTNNNSNTRVSENISKNPNAIDFDVVEEAYLKLASDITYNAKLESIVGKTIRVKGFALKKDSYLPKGYFAIGKLLVSCCAADSGYGGFIAKYDLSKIKEDHWYEITGVIGETTDKYGNEIGYIEVTNAKEIKRKNESMYAYSCDNYGDNGCDVLKNYDYEYRYE